MKSVTVKGELSKDGIRKMVREILAYEDELLEQTRLFTNQLAFFGISAAYSKIQGNKYASYIEFGKRYVIGSGKKARTVTMMLVYGKNIDQYIAEWSTDKAGNNIRTAEVNPILMAEYGSGFFADTSGHDNSEGLGGQGTFPDQSHAFDPNGWFWYVDGVKYHSFGEAPSAPMLEAYTEMRTRIYEAAKNVWG